MAERTLYSEASDPSPTGLEFLAQYHDRLAMLIDAAVFPLASVGGTGNAVTATIDPPLTAGLIAGMKATVTWAAANSGPVTLAIGGGAAVPVVDATGVDLGIGALAAGRRDLIEYVSGSWRILSGGGGEAGALPPYYWWTPTSTTWTKPAGFADDTPVLIEAWGGGGSGGRGTSLQSHAGGGGGGYCALRIRYADLPSSVVISIGAGGGVQGFNGAPGFAGGNTTVGSLLTAYGGGGGGTGPGTTEIATGGTGGGEVSGNAPGGGDGGPSSRDAKTIWGGGGGRSSFGSTTSRAVFGGGGGNGGSSLFGGNGGGSGAAGSAPGGGGGGNSNANPGAGARGEVRIWIG
ncbi:hypothetical protein [Fuscovulum blasticum]|uniref:glycine-rich domain-containing protein n=1 Tax=Fuscovulum blasticum TaxID=1075 RepID=UPI000D3E95EB|nr:hypothetical protein [Fuscovulum blasticum]AWD21624.1 hypothetical protein B6K69_07990 [Fuscovulum blasticum]